MLSGSSSELFIVELLFPSGAVFRHLATPVSKEKAEEIAAKYAPHFGTSVVPAGEYIAAKPTKTESLENIKTNNEYRSRVE